MRNIKIISVIIAFVDNDKKYLKQCLISLEKAARYARINLEYILIANGTNISDINYLNSPVNVIKSNKNLGFGQAINLGVKNAIGEWCLLSCPDVMTDRSCLKNMFNGISNKNLAVIGPRVLLSDGSFQYSILPFPTLRQIFLEQSYLYKLFPRMFKSPLSDKAQYSKITYADAVAGIWWLFKKSAFEKAGGFDERFFLYFEDVELCQRLKQKGSKIAFNPNSQVRHLLHKSTGGEASGLLYYRSLHNYLTKYHGSVYIFLTLVVFIIGTLSRIFFWSFMFAVQYNDKSKNISLKKIKFCYDLIKTCLVK